MSLPKFDLAGDVLTGAKIYFFAEGTVNTLTLTNTATNTETFTFLATSNVTSNSSNSATNLDSYQGETLGLFSLAMTLGGDTTPACPQGTPSASCSSVSFTPPPIEVTNLGLGFTTGTGGLGLNGVVKNITGGDLLNYVGGVGSTFTLGGSTKSFTSFSGGGNNIEAGIGTTAQFSAEIDYTYSVPVKSETPEPGTMALLGSALLGLGLLGKRLGKKLISTFHG